MVSCWGWIDGETIVRKVTVRVTCTLPRSISVEELKDYVEEAIWSYGGSFPVEAPFFDKDLRNSMVIKSDYRKRKK